MPLHQEPKRVCFLGDSQMGSLRIALEENLTSLPTGVEVEYWGATGPAFRQIDWQDGAIHATGDALDMALAINGNERAMLWDALVSVAGDDGITLVPQPEDTVIRGSLTKNEFARENALEDDDAGHKCPAFAARWMQDVWPLIQPAAQAA